MEKIRIGKIVNTHGLKGELKIMSETDFQEERYLPEHPLFIDFNHQMVEVYVKRFRPHQGFDLLTFEGFEDINLVEKFRNCSIYSEDQPISSLKKNEYQESRLLKMNVFQNHVLVGVVSGIRHYPQGDYLEVSKTDKALAVIPFRDEFIKSVDEKNQAIEIVEMEGLL